MTMFNLKILYLREKIYEFTYNFVYSYFLNSK